MIPVAINDVPISCINHAAIAHHISASLILAIMKKENGKNGDAIRNKNGSYDLGVCQVNTRWLPTLARYGYTRDDIRFDPCKNVMAASWILALSLANGKTAWSGVGEYHSHTIKYNQSYRASVKYYYQKIVSVINT